MNSLRRILAAFLLAASASAAPLARTVLYVTQTPMPDELLPTTHLITDSKMSIASAMQSPLADPAHVARGGALWVRYANGVRVNLTNLAGYGGAVDGNGNATGFQGAGSIAVQRPFMHWSGTKAIFAMIVGAPTSASDTTVFHWQLYELTNFAQGQTPVITYVAGQPGNYNNMQACYDTQGRIIFVSDAPRAMQAHLYPQLDEYLSLACNTGLWRLDRANGNELKHIVHAPSGAFTPFVDSFGRVMFVQWDHLSRDTAATYDRPPIAANGDAWTQTFNGNGTFDSESPSASFSLGTAANYATHNFHPEPRNFDKTALAATSVNGLPLSGLSFNQFFPWECREDGSGHEVDTHVGRHEFGGTSPLRNTINGDSNLVTKTFTTPTALNFFHLAESPTSPGTFYAVNPPEFGTHTAAPIFRYTSGPGVDPDTMQITYVTPIVNVPNPAFQSPLGTAVDIYRNPTPLSDGSLLAVHAAVTQYDSNTGSAVSPKSRYAFRLRTLNPSGATMVPDTVNNPTSPANVSITYYVNGTLTTYTAAPLWELDPVEVLARTAPAQLTSSIASVEQTVFDEEKVHAPTFQNYLRANNYALFVNRDSTRRDAADKQQPFNLKVAWSTTQTIGAPGQIYDIGWVQLFQTDAVRAYTHDGANPAAVPVAGRRCMPIPLHDTTAEMPVVPGAPAGAVKIANDGSWAAIVPAGRGLTWHMLDGSGTQSYVKERYTVSTAPGEVRTCAVCHGVNTADQAGNLGVPTNKPQALRPLLQFWRGNHPPGAMQHTAPAASALKNAGAATLSVARTGGSTGPVSVNFTTADGTALAGTDYTTASGTLTWADGDTSAKPISVPLLNNATIGASKSLTVALGAPLYGDLGATTVTTLTIAEPPFQAWQFAHFGATANTPAIAGDNADPDADGIPNLVEYFQGTIPAAHADTAPQAIAETLAGIPSLSLTFTRDPARTELTYTAQTSTDLITWTPVADTLTGTTGPLENRKASIPIAPGPQKYLRLKVTRP